MSNVLELILEKKNKEECLVTYLNPHSYLIARKNHEIYSEFSTIYSDGIALSLLLSLFFGNEERKSFDMTSMAKSVFSHAVQSGASVVLIGGQNEVAAVTAEKLKENFKGLKVLNCYDGYFLNIDHRNEIISEITSLQPDILIVGMGAPVQEIFLIDVIKSGWKGRGYTCGGFFHQTAKTKDINYYPKWINKLNLRWAYRIYDEPKLLKRYLLNYPCFLIFFLWDSLCLLSKKLTKK